MPSINFVLPHWLYWSGLIAFPLLAWFGYAAERRAGTPAKLSLVVGYMFLVTAGFVGLHRFYLRSRWGWVFIPLFCAVIFCNVEVKAAREAMSSVRLTLRTANFELDRAQTAARRGTPGAAERVEPARRNVAASQARMDSATATRDRWANIAAGFGLAIGGLLLVDAVLLPRLIRAAAEREARDPLRRFTPVEIPPGLHEQGTGEDPTLKIRTPAARALDWITERSGEFVAWWTVLSVFVYYYEVIVRFVFNSPTNWVHESMFLMFGMQYLIAGAYALKVDAHVRVDVFYVKFSDRGKAAADVLTSVFFFIFTGTMLATGWIFVSDATRLGEVSFTEWGIQVWPIKAAIPIGALVLMLQGLSKVIKDLKILTAKAA